MVQGLVALLSSFTVLRSEFLRDAVTYLAGLFLTFLCLLDGWVSLFEVRPTRIRGRKAARPPPPPPPHLLGERKWERKNPTLASQVNFGRSPVSLRLAAGLLPCTEKRPGGETRATPPPRGSTGRRGGRAGVPVPGAVPGLHHGGAQLRGPAPARRRGGAPRARRGGPAQRVPRGAPRRRRRRPGILVAFLSFGCSYLCTGSCPLIFCEGVVLLVFWLLLRREGLGRVCFRLRFLFGLRLPLVSVSFRGPAVATGGADVFDSNGARRLRPVCRPRCDATRRCSRAQAHGRGGGLLFFFWGGGCCGDGRGGGVGVGGPAISPVGRPRAARVRRRRGGVCVRVRVRARR